MQILPYNRVLKDLNGHQPQQLLDLLQTSFTFNPDAGSPRPSRKHEVSLYLAGKWHSLVFKKTLTDAPEPVDQLDVSLLQDHVLAPMFGIADPRTSKKINFVGGIRGTRIGTSGKQRRVCLRVLNVPHQHLRI